MFCCHEEQSAIGEISDESFDVSAMDFSAKVVGKLYMIIMALQNNFSTNGNGIQNYYKDLSS